MSKPLWEINSDLAELVATSVDTETGEVAEDMLERFEAIEGERSAKICAWGAYIKNVRVEAALIQAEAEVIQAQADVLYERAKARKRHADQRAAALCRLLPEGEKHEEPRVVVKWRKMPAKVDVTSRVALPEKYWRHYQSKAAEPELKAIAAALKAGEEVAGAKLVPQPQKLIVE